MNIPENVSPDAEELFLVVNSVVNKAKEQIANGEGLYSVLVSVMLIGVVHGAKMHAAGIVTEQLLNTFKNK